MENDLKLALGKILGEIYSVQNEISDLKHEDRPHSEATVQELRHGIEHVINQELMQGCNFTLTEERFTEMLHDLEDFEMNNRNAVSTMTGFYDLPLEVQNRYTRVEWLCGLKCMKANHQFTNIISIIEQSDNNSPIEFKNLDW